MQHQTNHFDELMAEHSAAFQAAVLDDAPTVTDAEPEPEPKPEPAGSAAPIPPPSAETLEELFAAAGAPAAVPPRHEPFVESTRLRNSALDKLQIFLIAWGDGKTLHPARERGVLGVNRVRASIESCGAALRALGDKQSTRADAARTHLQAYVKRVGAKLAVFEAYGRWLDGPAANALFDRYERALSAVDIETFNLRCASDRTAAREAREKLDLAEAQAAACVREIHSLASVLSFPNLLEPETIHTARDQTRYLAERANAPGDLHLALSLDFAIDQGRTASADLARLYVCFESPDASPDALALYELRWNRYLARTEIGS